MSKSLKILIIPIQAVGHMYACIGLAQVLIQSGHKVSFILNEQWMGSLSKYGIEEVFLSEEGLKPGEDPAKHWAELVKQMGGFQVASSLKKMIDMTTSYEIVMKTTKSLDMKLEALLKDIRPDVMILDQCCGIPSVIKSGIPWVLVCSTNPLFLIDDERTPPGGSGLPTNGDQNEWKKFRNTLRSAQTDIWNQYNQYLVSRGVEALETNWFINYSKYMNIFGFPSELDYTDVRPLPPNWCRFDNLMRTEGQTNFEIPEQLRGKSGKLIYFSMGTMGSADISLMKRLIHILGKSKHRFIVSKGPLHSEYSLADNMWGQQSVPQMQVLPIVDLVITHGGNNTVCETFYFGKPMIVMPLFNDQLDNGQRVQEKGFGLRLDPNLCTESELLNGIENLVNNKELTEKLSKISVRIQSENSIGKLPKLIEELVEKNRKI